MKQPVFYKSGYKHVLQHTHIITFPALAGSVNKRKNVSKFIFIYPDGTVVFKPGYAWDGMTNAPDTKQNLRTSLYHDGLYQLIREGILPPSARATADRILKETCLEDGAWRITAATYYFFVTHFGGPYASPSARRPLKKAP